MVYPECGFELACDAAGIPRGCICRAGKTKGTKNKMESWATERVTSVSTTVVDTQGGRPLGSFANCFMVEYRHEPPGTDVPYPGRLFGKAEMESDGRTSGCDAA